MYTIMTAEELIRFNREKAEKWLRECPKSHRLKKYVAVAEKYAAGKLIIRDGMAWTIGRTIMDDRHIGWAISEQPYCMSWKIDPAARAAHDAEISAIREATPHFNTISDIGSLRIFADGVELLLGGVGGDGDHRVFLTALAKDTDLSLGGREDSFICTFKARKLQIAYHDCDEAREMVYESESEHVRTFNAYNVFDDLRGWKIEEVINA